LQNGLTMIWPGQPRRALPGKVKILVLDFDGVLTDNRVWMDQNGNESVVANRSDSLWVDMLREKGVQVFVISKETNPVVAARCRKMNIPCIQGEDSKETALKKLLVEKGIDPAQAVYCGNDVNDLPCFPLVGWAVAVADSVPEVVRQADFVLNTPGGRGAVRELCEIILTGNRF
jgi:YrbI family 3-deoxy-D-manno-octulosonate 8-phosphate phosphatase